MAKIGFIGLGHMGNPMVKNLLAAGHKVTVYDMSVEAILSLKQHGAISANNAQAVCKEADVIFTMVQTGEQVSELCLGEEGIFQTIPKNALYIDSSSIDINISRIIHNTAEQANIAMLDAPVSGGVAGAKAATLTIMVGGSDKHFKQAKPYLQNLGQHIIHAGPSGSGQAAKICNNMLLGISMIGVCEAFNLAEKLGLDSKKLFEISSKSSGQCWSMTSYAPVPGLVENSPANNAYQPGFTAKMMLKDLLLSQKAAQSNHTATPLGSAATALYELYVDHGNDMVDFSGIIQFLAGK